MPSEAPARVDERDRLCPQCGIGVAIEDDGSCNCGADTCSLEELRALLANKGLHVVTDEDRDILDQVHRMPPMGPIGETQHLVRPEAKAVLDALKQALRRLGDDPPYYGADEAMCGELAMLNPRLPEVLTVWAASLAHSEATP